MSSPANARRAIRRAATARKRADDAKRKATDQLAQALVEGAAAGLTVREMQRLAGLSIQGYYQVRARAKGNGG